MHTYRHTAVSLTAVALMGIGLVAHAEDAAPPNPPNPPLNFCARITTTLDDTYHERLTKQKTTITQKLGEIDAKVAQKRSEVDADRAKKRAEADQRRQERYARLAEIAGGDAAKIAAVNQFKTTIEAAVVVRKAAVDAAVAAFRAAQDQARSQRSIEINVAFSTYEGLMKSAITTAQTQCTAGTPNATVRATFTESVKNAQNAYKTERTAITERYKEKVGVAQSTRATAVEGATSTFKAAAEAARAILKDALTN